MDLSEKEAELQRLAQAVQHLLNWAAALENQAERAVSGDGRDHVANME